MRNAKTIVGLVASGLLFLSALAHTITGGPAILAELRAAKVPKDLENGILVGWQFGGMMMAVLALVVGHLFLRQQKGHHVSLFPALVAGTGYLLFGLWAMLGVDPQPFYLVFIVPGILLLFAGSESSDPA